MKVSSGDVQVVILFDVSVHEVRVKVVFDFSVLTVGRLHVGCSHRIYYATEFGGKVERRVDFGGRDVVAGQADRQFFLPGQANFTQFGFHCCDHVKVFYVVCVEVVVGDTAFLKVAVSARLVFDN